jgi:hypothetical protein
LKGLSSLGALEGEKRVVFDNLEIDVTTFILEFGKLGTNVSKILISATSV